MTVREAEVYPMESADRHRVRRLWRGAQRELGWRPGNFIDPPDVTRYAASAARFGPARVFCTCVASLEKHPTRR